jgi:hypothetical protein
VLDFLSLIPKDLISKGYEAYKDRKEFNHLKIAIKEQLRRELRLNIEIIDEFLPKESQKKIIKIEDYSKQHSALRTSRFAAIANDVIPLSELLSEKINKDNYSKARAEYIKKCAGDTHLHHLVERTYFRLEIAKVYSEGSASSINVGYLKFLVLTSIKSL